MPLYFGMFVSVAAYLVGMALKKKLGWAIRTPFWWRSFWWALLKATGISYGDYNQGASYISYFLTPATVCLAIPLYKQLELLKKNLAAVLCGITTGVAGSVLSIFAMSLVFRLERVHYVSLLPKSITTAIGMGVTEEAGSIVTITIVSIIFTGILGNIVAEGWFKPGGDPGAHCKGTGLGQQPMPLDSGPGAGRSGGRHEQPFHCRGRTDDRDRRSPDGGTDRIRKPRSREACPGGRRVFMAEALKKRSEMDPQFQWDLRDLIPTEKALEELLELEAGSDGMRVLRAV